jgi:hypothetical protein
MLTPRPNAGSDCGRFQETAQPLYTAGMAASLGVPTWDWAATCSQRTHPVQGAWLLVRLSFKTHSAAFAAAKLSSSIFDGVLSDQVSHQVGAYPIYLSPQNYACEEGQFECGV